MCLKGKIGSARHKNLIAHIPLVVVARRGTFSANVKRASFDSDLLPQLIGFGLGRGAGFNLCPHQDFVAFPTLDRNTAVGLAVNADCPARGQRLFFDLAMTRQPVIFARLATLHRAFGFLLGRDDAGGETGDYERE